MGSVCPSVAFPPPEDPMSATEQYSVETSWSFGATIVVVSISVLRKRKNMNDKRMIHDTPASLFWVHSLVMSRKYITVHADSEMARLYY